MFKDTAKSLKSKIHIAKSQLKMDEESYRALLMHTVGKNSCAAMTVAELCQVLKAMEQKGFRVRNRFKEKRPVPRQDKAIYLAKITALLSNQGKPQKYADSIAKQAFGIDFVHWLEPWQLKKVIQMLAVYEKRHK